MRSHVPQLPPIPRLPPLTVPLLPVPADPELIRFRRATFNTTPSVPPQRAGTARNCRCLRCNPPPDLYHRQLQAFLAPPIHYNHNHEQPWHHQPVTPPPRDMPPPLSPSSSFFTTTDSSDSDSSDSEDEGQGGADTYHHPLSFPQRSLSLDSGRAAAAAAASASAYPTVTSSVSLASALAGVGGAFQQQQQRRRWDGAVIVDDGPWSQPVSVFEIDSSSDEESDEEDDETGLDSEDEAELLALVM